MTDSGRSSLSREASPSWWVRRSGDHPELLRSVASSPDYLSNNLSNHHCTRAQAQWAGLRKGHTHSTSPFQVPVQTVHAASPPLLLCRRRPSPPMGVAVVRPRIALYQKAPPSATLRPRSVSGSLGLSDGLGQFCRGTSLDFHNH